MSTLSFWCLYCYVRTNFIPFSSVSFVSFEQVNVCCVRDYICYINELIFCLTSTTKSLRKKPGNFSDFRDHGITFDCVFQRNFFIKWYSRCYRSFAMAAIEKPWFSFAIGSSAAFSMFQFMIVKIFDKNIKITLLIFTSPESLFEKIDTLNYSELLRLRIDLKENAHHWKISTFIKEVEEEKGYYWQFFLEACFETQWNI